MPMSRRAFVRSVGAGGAGALAFPLIAARGHESWSHGGPGVAFASDDRAAARAAAPDAIRLDSNENPNGPSATTLDAVRAAMGESARYPDQSATGLVAAIAKAHGVAEENVLLGCGSGEILRMATYACTSRTRPLVTGAPSFEDPARYAEVIGAPVLAVPVTDDLRLDLAGMGTLAARGAGLVFLCNPNNPTGTVHSAGAVRDLVRRVLAGDARATVLVDEAYHEYVDDAGYATAIPLAMENPRVVVSRTFSKVHGLAGLRIGYAIGAEETLRAMRRHRLANGINLMGAAAAAAALGQHDHIERERSLNREARDLTRRGLESAGCRVRPSETNFLMAYTGRDARTFQAACREHGVLVGRPFPPLTHHARISIGTVDEMRRAVDVFRAVLSAS